MPTGFRLLSLTLLLAGLLSAAPIQYLYSGSGSGDLSGTPFTDANFIVTVLGDTTAVAFQPSLGALGALNLTGSIAISGVGTFSFANPLFVFTLFGNEFAGFGDFANGNLISFSQAGIGLAAHDLVSNYGPFGVGVNTALGQFNGADVVGGQLTFSQMSDITYQSRLARTEVPEPGSMLLMAAGIGALALLRRR